MYMYRHVRMQKDADSPTRDRYKLLLDPHIILYCIVLLLTELWTTDKKPTTVFTIPQPSIVFSIKFNLIQGQLEAISGMDELLSGYIQLVHCGSNHTGGSQWASVRLLLFTQVLLDTQCALYTKGL